jgi:ubiquitin-protein ligase
MLSSAERTPRLSKRPVLTDTTLRQYGNTLDFPVDVVTISQFPHRAPHAKLQQSVQPAAKLTSGSPTHDDRTKRIMREVCCSSAPFSRLLISFQLKALIVDPHPQIDLYVNDSDMSFLKLILEVCVVTSGVNVTDVTRVLKAPKDETKCPYRNGTFLLTCDIPQNYPREPPEIRFVTFILHPNVSDVVVVMCMSLLMLSKYQGLKTRKGELARPMQRVASEFFCFRSASRN